MRWIHLLNDVVVVRGGEQSERERGGDKAVLSMSPWNHITATVDLTSRRKKKKKLPRPPSLMPSGSRCSGDGGG